MKTLFKSLLVILSVAMFYKPALAGSGDAAGAILVTFATAKGMESLAVDSLEQLELEEWKDDRSQSTAILGDTCGFVYEARMIGDLRDNYLWLSLKNNNTTQRSFNPIEVEFKFSDGIERRPDLFRFNEVFVEPGRLYNMILPFPSKEDFKGQQSLDVTVPFYGEGKKCVLPLKLIRNPKVQDTMKSTSSQNILEMDVGFGGSNFTGNLAKAFETSHSVTHLNMAIYGAKNGGMYFGFRAYGSENINSQLAAAEGYGTDWHSNVSEFYIGYTHRFVHEQDLMSYLRFGIGGASIRVTNDLYVNQDSLSASTLDFQWGFQRFFSRIKSGIWLGNYYWGAGLNGSHLFTSKTMKNGTKFDGGAGSALVFIGVGM